MYRIGGAYFTQGHWFPPKCHTATFYLRTEDFRLAWFSALRKVELTN